MNIIESNLKFKEMAYGNNPIMIVLHNADASECTIEDIHSWHLNNGWAGCGYHYFVRKNGQIFRGRPENAIGSHCPGANDKSIGICAEGRYMTETMPEVQKQAILELNRDIIFRYAIKQIYGHKELYSTDCPGVNFPLADIKNKSFIKEEENELLENLVVYNFDNTVDGAFAKKIARFFKCPTFDSETPTDYSKLAKNVYCVGAPGKLAFTSYAKRTFRGADRYITEQLVDDFIANGGK